ncbi:MAG: Sec-independent protein translocase subunit TatA/TatB [Rubrobacteraceae bacterium]
MFGIGPGELVIIGVLFLVIFGPDKVPQMARDIGKFTNEARRAIEDFREDLTQANDDDEDDQDDDYYNDDEQSKTDHKDEDDEDDAVERDL